MAGVNPVEPIADGVQLTIDMQNIFGRAVSGKRHGVRVNGAARVFSGSRRKSLGGILVVQRRCCPKSCDKRVRYGFVGQGGAPTLR